MESEFHHSTRSVSVVHPTPWTHSCNTSYFSSVQFSSVAQSCLTLCDPMNCSTPGLPVYHQLPEFTQTHIHRVSDTFPAISSSVISFSSCAQSLPASESFPMSQHLAWGGQSTGVSALASFLPKNTQDWFPLECSGWISLQSKGLSRVFSNTTVQKHPFFGPITSWQIEEGKVEVVIGFLCSGCLILKPSLLIPKARLLAT